MAIYRVTLKSQEQRGASQPNIVELGFDSDGDCNTFGQNMESVCQAAYVSGDVLVSSDYTLPYPDGTDSMVRASLTDGVGHWQTIRVYDTPTGFDAATRSAALIAAGFQMFPSGFVPTSGNVTVFTPGPSV